MESPSEKIEVMSYLATNWGQSHERPPALILNTEAHHLELLAWCWGEVHSLLASANVCTAGNENIPVHDMSAIFLSRLGPLAEVMSVAVQAGMNERQTREAASALKGVNHV